MRRVFTENGFRSILTDRTLETEKEFRRWAAVARKAIYISMSSKGQKLFLTVQMQARVNCWCETNHELAEIYVIAYSTDRNPVKDEIQDGYAHVYVHTRLTGSDLKTRTILKNNNYKIRKSVCICSHVDYLFIQNTIVNLIWEYLIIPWIYFTYHPANLAFSLIASRIEYSHRFLRPPQNTAYTAHEKINEQSYHVE